MYNPFWIQHSLFDVRDVHKLNRFYAFYIVYMHYIRTQNNSPVDKLRMIKNEDIMTPTFLTFYESCFTISFWIDKKTHRRLPNA